MDAKGVDDPKTGLLRGQFEASERYLAKRWNWGKSAVHRFMADLMEKTMISRLDRKADHLADRSPDRFNICNYDLYNSVRTARRTAERTAERTKSNKAFNEVSIPTTETSFPTSADGGEMTRPKNEAYDIYAQIFEQVMGAPYVSTTNDFSKLANYRRICKIGTLETPRNWESTCRNYLETPQGKHTLADLAVRFGEFVKAPHNIYGRPVTATKETDIHAVNLETYRKFVAKGKDDAEK